MPGASRSQVQTPAPAENRPSRFRWQVMAIWAVAFAIRFAYIWQIRPSPFFEVLLGDARGYDAWAQQIAAGDWVGQGVFYQAPLYPYFLGTIYSIAGRDLFLTRIVQADDWGDRVRTPRTCRTSSALRKGGTRRGIGARHLRTSHILRRVASEIRARRVFHVPRALASERSPGQSGHTVALVFAGPRPRRVWRSPARTGLSSSRRFCSGVCLQPDVSWQSQTSEIHDGGFCSRSGCSSLLPVAVRNRVVGGEWHMTTSQFGPNFYLGNNPDADGTAGFLRQGRGAVEYERQDATDLAQAAEGRNLTPREVSSYWTSQALAYIRANPWAWVKLEARKVRLLANAAELIDTESQDSYEEWSRVLSVTALVGHFGVLAPLAVLGVDGRMARSAKAVAVLRNGRDVRGERAAVLRVGAIPAASGALSHAHRSRRAFAAANLHTRSRQGQRPPWRPPASSCSRHSSTGRCGPPQSCARQRRTTSGMRCRTPSGFTRRSSITSARLRFQPDYAPAYVNLGAALLAQRSAGRGH